MVGGTQQCLYACMDEVVYQICFLALYATYSKSPLCPWLCLYAAILHNVVVICFQIYYLWQNDNNKILPKSSLISLWFAFRFIIFDRMITTINRVKGWRSLLWFAFRFIIFDRMITTCGPVSRSSARLWFAFRFIIFDRMITTTGTNIT